MLIKNGIVSSNTINIVQKLIPESHTQSRPQYSMIPKYITIHNTGDNGATALQIANYVTTQTGYKSWHFTIGKDVVYQHLPITESGWHSGDGQYGTGNRESIGIEICEVAGAEETAIKFVAELIKVSNINIENIVPHKHWSGKICPRLILPHWNVFIDNIKKEMNKLTFDIAKKTVQDKAGLDNNSMQYLEFYKYGEDLIKKLAAPMVNNIVVNPVEEPKLEEKVIYTVTPNGTHQLIGSKKGFGTKIVNQNNRTIEEPNCSNCSFFWYLDTAKTQTYSTSILIQDGVIIQDVANHYYNFGCPQNVFIIYKNGKVEMKKIFFAHKELDYKNIQFASGGVGLRDTTNPNFKYDPASEGFKKAINKVTGKTEDQSGVLRQANKTVIGYNSKLDKIVILVRPNIYHSHPLYYDLLELVKDCELDIVCSVDGGGSTVLNNETDMVVYGDGRRIYNLIGWFY